MSTENQQEQITPVELMKRRIQTTEFFKNQIEILKLQAEYQKLKADIEESALREISCIIKRTHLTMGPKEEQENQEAEQKAEANS